MTVPVVAAAGRCAAAPAASPARVRIEDVRLGVALERRVARPALAAEQVVDVGVEVGRRRVGAVVLRPVGCRGRTPAAPDHVGAVVAEHPCRRPSHRSSGRRRHPPCIRRARRRRASGRCRRGNAVVAASSPVAPLPTRCHRRRRAAGRPAARDRPGDSRPWNAICGTDFIAVTPGASRLPRPTMPPRSPTIASSPLSPLIVSSPSSPYMSSSPGAARHRTIVGPTGAPVVAVECRCRPVRRSCRAAVTEHRVGAEGPGGLAGAARPVAQPRRLRRRRPRAGRTPAGPASHSGRTACRPPVGSPAEVTALRSVLSVSPASPALSIRCRARPCRCRRGS